MKKFLITTGLVAAFLMTGCTQRLGSFTVASTQNVSNLETVPATHHVKGEDCINYVLSIPFGNFQNRIQEAMDKAIENGKAKGYSGDLLINARIYHNAWSAILYGRDCIIVEGDLTRIKK